jgi:hypothetical protein
MVQFSSQDRSMQIMKPAFKARDYVFRKPTMAEAFVRSFPNLKLAVPHVREPKLARNGFVISADFKA